jgi:hypothetical protein
MMTPPGLHTNPDGVIFDCLFLENQYSICNICTTFAKPGLSLFPLFCGGELTQYTKCRNMLFFALCGGLHFSQNRCIIRASCLPADARLEKLSTMDLVCEDGERLQGLTLGSVCASVSEQWPVSFVSHPD